ncbi:MAG: hypothetical protein PWR07_1226 [Bacillota bacterium]|nr:hypothetical protein [Bacillota bacterium]
MEDGKETERIIEDLKFIKAAIAKSSGIIRWLPLSRVMRVVYLMMGLVITALCGALYLLIRRHGSFAESPAWVRIMLLSLGVTAFLFIAVYKVVGIMASARKIRSDYTLFRLLEEVYSVQSILILVRFFVAGVGVVSFLATRGFSVYIVPALAILFGLMFNALVSVFSFKELVISGDWFLATGLLVLFLEERLDPLLGLILTFGLGFIAAFVAGVVMAGSEGHEGEHGRG